MSTGDDVELTYSSGRYSCMIEVPRWLRASSATPGRLVANIHIVPRLHNLIHYNKKLEEAKAK
ncbi:hypothetical protein BVRB_8g182750 [Beta vulgaris subsp. vulgaris]|nr:hypothetical protein BVRB_8g182750 [Beta vulgaris subsp. vulgaris]